MTSFVSEFVFYLLVFFTHLPMFLLYAVWFKNVRMRLRASNEGKARSVTKSISARMHRKRHLLERKNNDDITTENASANDDDEDDDEEAVQR